MRFFRSTKKHQEYWKDRVIDWEKEYLATWNHPHRQLIIDELKKMTFGSLLELGCASGPNLYRIMQEFPRVQVGGLDINAEAIAVAKKYLPPTSVLEVGPLDDMFYSSKSGDCILTDASLIYIGHDKIDAVMREIKRVSRRHVIFCEFHSTNIFKRWGLKFATGYNAYNYRKLLEKHGFYDIQIKKLPDLWDGEPWKTFGHLITARV